MARHPQGKNALSSAYKPDGKLVDRFAKMSLKPTASQTQFKKKKKKKENKKRADDYILPAEYANTIGAIPNTLYEYIKEAAEVLRRPGFPNDIDRLDSLDLRGAESDIERFCCGVPKRWFPPGWKYDREYAISFTSGHRKVFTDVDGDIWIK